MKNRIEKGLRLDLNVSMPHSKAVLASRPFISIHRDTRKITATNTIVRASATNKENTKFIY
jgi:shikimate 5-dehydrogenase